MVDSLTPIIIMGEEGRGHGRDNDSRIGFNSQNTDNRPITRGYSREEW
jgi:hypothetical protein